MTEINERIKIDRIMALVKANGWETETVSIDPDGVRVTIIKRGITGKTEEIPQ